MKNQILFGTSGFGREVVWAFERLNKVTSIWNLLDFMDDADEIQGAEINGYKVIGKTRDVVNYSDAYYVEIFEHVTIGVGTIICENTISRSILRLAPM